MILFCIIYVPPSYKNYYYFIFVLCVVWCVVWCGVVWCGEVWWGVVCGVGARGVHLT